MSRIDARSKSVRELLQGRKYSIDEYQREYKWEPKNIEELIDDLYSKFATYYDVKHERQAVEKYDSYFLGSIILSRRNGQEFIIDGQQRLTSLTLLLIYLNHLQREFEVKDPVNLEDLIFSVKYGKRSFNLNIPERLACLEALYNTESFDATDGDESVRNMVARYNDISEQFPDKLQGKALPYFIDWLLEKVELVEISANSDEDAYTIFETMNDRGRPLNPTDILKGYLLSQILDENDRSEANRQWKRRMLELTAFGREEDSEFIKAWLRARYARTIRERKKGATNLDFERIGTAFHKWVRDEKSTIKLSSTQDFRKFTVDLFSRYSRAYLQAQEAARQFTPGFETIFYNSSNNFTLQSSVLLAPIKPEDDQSTADRKMRLVATYIDIFIARRAVNYITLNYSSLTYAMFILMKRIRGLSDAQLAAFLKQEVEQMEWTFEGTKDGQKKGVRGFGLNQRSKRYIHHILARMTSHIEVQSGMPNRFPEYVSAEIKRPFQIEHLWAYKYEGHEDEFKYSFEFSEARDRIGALVLLPGGINQSFGSLPYEEKRNHYVSQNLLAAALHEQAYERNPGFRQYIERSGLPFRPHPTFKKADLEARQELYLQLCEEIWSPKRFDKELSY